MASEPQGGREDLFESFHPKKFEPVLIYYLGWVDRDPLLAKSLVNHLFLLLM
jgi:hypothetical protein